MFIYSLITIASQVESTFLIEVGVDHALNFVCSDGFVPAGYINGKLSVCANEP